MVKTKQIMTTLNTYELNRNITQLNNIETTRWWCSVVVSALVSINIANRHWLIST